MKKYLIYIFVMLGIVLTSCDEKEDYEQINSQVVDAAGEWWIKFSADGAEGPFVKVLTYNTSADVATEMWISDGGNWKDVLVKCPVDINNLTFSGSNLDNNNSDDVITVSNGQITLNGATSTTGVVTDAISFQIQFSSEPGVTYQASGHRKTGFLEDEH